MVNTDSSILRLDDLLLQLGANPTEGLSGSEVKSRQARDGPNEIPRHRPSLWAIYLRPMLNWLIIVWLINSAVLLLLGNFLASIFALTIISINAIVFVFQQIRAQIKLEALRRMAPYTSTVIRDGEKQVIPSREIVIGDILELEQGNLVPADARLLETSYLQLNESSLTGESVPVQKIAHDLDHTNWPLPLQQRDNSVYSGTIIATGHCRATVVATGANTELGKIYTTMAQTATPDIPLRKKINKFAKYLVLGVLVLLTVKFIIVIIPLAQLNALTLESVRDALSGAIVTGFNLMPMNIPFLTTITLLVGAIAMITYNVFVQNISALESLGRASVVCSDKTGTITKNEMTIRRIWCDRHVYIVTGQGYSSKGSFKEITIPGTPSVPVEVANLPVLSQLIIGGFLNNNASLISGSGSQTRKNKGKIRGKQKAGEDVTQWSIIGSPTEAALLVLFKKAQFDEQAIKARYQEIFEYPFDSALKRMTKVFRIDNQYVVHCKGAPEFILSLCTQAILDGEVTSLTDDAREEITQASQIFEAQGYRVLSLASKDLSEVPDDLSDARDIIESDLTYLGFICVQDPPRAGVSKSVKECKEAGIKVLMVTGDSPLTAQSIGQEVGIFTQGDLVVEGEQIETLSADDFRRTTIFARVSPQHKETIISRLQEGEKNVIAMTGDGVNDALALHHADVGISMGVMGTDVAKQAADIILTDDSFNSIVHGIREGRSLFSKIRAIVVFYLMINLMEAIVFFSFSFPNHWQYYFLLLTSHNFTGFALAFDKRDPDIMKQPPHGSEGILSKNLVMMMIIQAIIMAVFVALMYFLNINGLLNPILSPSDQNSLYSGGTVILATPQQKTVTMTMVTIVLTETLCAFSIRRMNKSALGTIMKDLSFWFVILCLLAPAALLLMYFPMFNSLRSIIAFAANLGIDFQLVSLGARDLLACIGFALFAFAGLELVKWVLRRRKVHL